MAAAGAEMSGRLCMTNSSLAKKLPLAACRPSSVGTWPMMVTQTRPSMKPRITGVEMNAATHPMRVTPNSRKKAPIRRVIVPVRVAKSAEPRAARAPTVRAEMTPVAVSGPTTSRREVPSSA